MFARKVAVLEEVRLPDVLRQVVEMNGGSLERHQVALDLQLSPDLPALTTDRHNLLQILTNLLTNAIHATKANPADNRSIVIGARLVEDARVAIMVRDNGAGIAAENLTQVFRLGFTTRKEGHGFGLHSGALAAKSLGGTLDVASDGPGRGATFTLVIPVAPPAPPTQPS